MTVTSPTEFAPPVGQPRDWHGKWIAKGSPGGGGPASVAPEVGGMTQDDVYKGGMLHAVHEMSEGERASVASYIKGDSTTINATLRDELKGLTEDRKRDNLRKVGALDRAISQSKIPHDAVIHRGIANDDVIAHTQVGETITDKGYLSTSRDPSYAAHRADRARSPTGEEGWTLTMQVPSGTHAVSIEALSTMGVFPRAMNQMAEHEQEIVLPRGTTWHVVGRDENAHSIQMELVPAEGMVGAASDAQPVAAAVPDWMPDDLVVAFERAIIAAVAAARKASVANLHRHAGPRPEPEAPSSATVAATSGERSDRDSGRRRVGEFVPPPGQPRDWHGKWIAKGAVGSGPVVDAAHPLAGGPPVGDQRINVNPDDLTQVGHTTWTVEHNGLHIIVDGEPDREIAAREADAVSIAADVKSLPDLGGSPGTPTGPTRPAKSVTIVTEPPPMMGVLGWTNRSETLSEFGGNYRIHLSNERQNLVLEPGHHPASATGLHADTDTVIHEYGHLVDDTSGTVSRSTEPAMTAVGPSPRTAPEISQYADFSRGEYDAESFLEWTATGGKTLIPMVQRMGEDEGWNKLAAPTPAVVAAGSTPTNPDVFDEGAWRHAIADQGGPVIEQAIRAGAHHATIGYGFSVTDPAMEKVVAEHVAAIQNWDTELRSSVSEFVSQGIADGWSVDQTASKLTTSPGSPLSTARARTIARTELIAAANHGALRGARTIGAKQKQWLATDDDRTRPTHALADGQTVAIDQPFTVGGWPLDFPGDPNAPVGERVNCRCTVLFLDQDEPGPVTNDDRVYIQPDDMERQGRTSWSSEFEGTPLWVSGTLDPNVAARYADTLALAHQALPFPGAKKAGIRIQISPPPPGGKDTVAWLDVQEVLKKKYTIYVNGEKVGPGPVTGLQFFSALSRTIDVDILGLIHQYELMVEVASGQLGTTEPFTAAPTTGVEWLAAVNNLPEYTAMTFIEWVLSRGKTLVEPVLTQAALLGFGAP